MGYYFDDDDSNDEGVRERLKVERELVDCQWNSRFQRVMDDMKGLTSNTPLATKIRVYTELSNLAEDFNFIANTYAKIIITEVGVPIAKKTIKPIDIGGQAGGEKVRERKDGLAVCT
jgi:hypothetical protein